MVADCPDPSQCTQAAEIATLKAKLENLESWTKDLDTKVDKILEILNMSRGGWLMFLKVCAVVAAGVGLLIAVFKEMRG